MSAMKSWLFIPAFLLLIETSCDQKQVEESITSDPLPSWNESESKNQIITFVKAVTDENGTEFIDPKNRIATFDNDGTLWSEQPLYFQLIFALDRIKALASEHPEWEQDSLFRAVIHDDTETVLHSGMSGLMKILMQSHAGMTTAGFEEIVMQWITTAKHPETGKLYTEMIYQPMLELINYLKQNNFTVYIVSGGGIEFMRPWAEEVYGIPPNQVVGSSIKVVYEMTEKGPVLRRLPEINFIDDKDGKPVAIHQYIGKRSIAAFGNSDGDLQMLQWTAAATGTSLQVYVHHTDSEREWAYDRTSHIGRLDKGLDEATERGWTIIDMKKDWKVVYPFELQ